MNETASNHKRFNRYDPDVVITHCILDRKLGHRIGSIVHIKLTNKQSKNKKYSHIDKPRFHKHLTVTLNIAHSYQKSNSIFCTFQLQFHIIQNTLTY